MPPSTTSTLPSHPAPASSTTLESPKAEQSPGKQAWKPRYDRRQSWDPQEKRREMQMRATAVGAVQTGAGFTEADK